MAVFAQHFVLGEQQALDGTHQRTAFAGQVGGGFLQEGGLEQVACAIVPDPQLPLVRRLERYLLPIRLRFTSWRSQLVYPNINDD